MREATGPGPASIAAQLRGYLNELRHLPPGDEHDRVRHAADELVRRVCCRDGATHYEVLCVARHATRESVKESYHLLMALIHPDRQDAARQSWPTDCAQRVNRAYAVLADEPTRKAYDASLGGNAPRPDAARESAHRAPARRGRRRDHFVVRFAKVSLAVMVVLATLLLLEVWVSDVSGGSSVLQSALRDARGRDIAAASDGPRFIGNAPLHAPSLDMDPLPPAKRLANVTMQWPLASNAAVPPPPVIDFPRLQPSPAPRMAAMAQVSLQAPSGEPRVASRDIEDLVVKVIGYYEAGEADKLMGLVAKDSYWKTLRMRQAYADFFGATRSRRLRVDSLAWQTAADAAHARGMATLTTEYFDTPGVKEQRVDVEMDIALRDGRAVITRLALFPNAP
jgi:hypothetical protein